MTDGEKKSPTYKDFFANKRVTLMGLGLLGRGAGDSEFLAGLGADLLITDRKSEAELAASLERLKNFQNIHYRLNEHRLEDFRDTDMVIKAAGVPLDSPYIAEARTNGVPVYMTTTLFAKFAREIGARIVGVTGTRGKSTVTHLIHHALMAAGRRARMGGNVRGVSTLAQLPQVEAEETIVLELDSWQLQGFGDLEISPDIAVFTNLMSDHLNYYPDMDAYFADKANIFKYQKAGDVLIAGQGISERIEAMQPAVKPVVPLTLPEEWTLKIPGEHNRENAALAAQALRALGLSEGEIRSGLESFEGVEGRLQNVGSIKGIDIYNDNNATTPDATIAALRSLAGEGRPLTLIIGGSDKGLSLEGLAEEIHERVRDIVFLEGTGTQKLQAALDDNAAPMHGGIESALAEAVSKTPPSGIILFSPAFASFGLFKNEYDRNDSFLAAVEKLR